MGRYVPNSRIWKKLIITKVEKSYDMFSRLISEEVLDYKEYRLSIQRLVHMYGR